jgi:pheromone alpha factor receptor
MSSNFDPYKQSVIFYSSDGAPFEVPIKVVNDFYLYCFISCINFGAQFGASLIIFIVLLLLTRPEKRASSVFFLNCGALLVNIGRMLSQFIYFTSDYLQAYQYFASDSSRASTSTRANSILRVVLAFLLLVCIEISLVLQVQVVCANLRRRYRVVLLCVSILVALILFGFRMGLMIVNCKEIISPQSANPLLVWLESNTNIVVNISICFFCIIFIAKLGHAIHQRKILGMGCFGPMKVIFIMGCQTLVIPGMPFIYLSRQSPFN